MSDTTLEDKVDTLIKDVSEIKATLKYNGMGLIPTFEQHCAQDREFRQDYYSFKRRCTAIFFFLLGSGVLGISTVKLIEMVR